MMEGGVSNSEFLSFIFRMSQNMIEHQMPQIEIESREANVLVTVDL